MGTKEFGWSSSRMFRARFLALALSVSGLAVVASAGTAYAADQKKARDKIVDLNKQALLSYEAKDFEAAKELLTKALKEAKQSGLEDDKMTARTYLHLGAVYLAGYQDQTVALQNFTLAKKIRPDIQLTPSIETPELKSVFDQATVEAEPTPEPRSTRSQPAMHPTPAASSDLGGGGEPDLPSNLAAPLMCSTPEESPPGRELSVRCAVKPGVNAKSVQMHYRAPGAEAYQALPMHRTAKGWYLATVPGHVMKGPSIQVYYDARDGSDNEVASNGQIDSPSVIEIRKKGGGGVASAGPIEGDPLEKIKRQKKLEEYEAGLHRRREGAFFVGLGAGTGWGWAPAGDLEWSKNRANKPIKVSAVTTTTGLVTAVAELGYMVSDSFSLSGQLRLEYIQQEQKTSGLIRSGDPSVWAPAGFVRALWYVDLTSDGNFQFVFGPNVGYGFIRLPVKPQVLALMDNPSDPDGNQVPDPDWTISKTDTRPVGTVLFGPSGGFTYHVSRHFALALDVRALIGVPKIGFAVEGNLALQFAFGGKAGPAPEAEEGEGEGDAEPGPANEAPAATDSPGSSSSDSEEE